jgi:MFS family permease
MQPSERRPSVNRRGLVIVATLATAYMASHFFRASNVTIGLDLMRDLSVGPGALGALTGAFFFGFAAMQIPCGFFFDHFGPRRTIVAMLMLATLGGIIFTTAPSWPVLLTGRVLLGAGFGVMLIGSMVVITRWFPPDRFSTITAVVLSVGLLGNLLATTPLAWASEISGWRAVFGAAVLFTAVAAIAVWIVVRDAPDGHPFLDRKAEPAGEMFRGLIEVLRNPRLKPILALNFFNYACTFTVQGLWGGPYLREVHGFSPIAAGNVLFAAVVAYQFGMLLFGPLDRLFDTRKWIAAGGTMVIVGLLAVLAIPSAPPAWVSVAAIVAMGFFSASSTMILTHGRGIFPDRLIGRGIATLNTSVMLGVAVMQTLSGLIVGAFEPLANGERSEIAYRSLFGFLTVILIVAVAVYSLRSEDIKPSHEMRLREQARAA